MHDIFFFRIQADAMNQTIQQKEADIENEQTTNRALG